jgi:hypothetical protein
MPSGPRSKLLSKLFFSLLFMVAILFLGHVLPLAEASRPICNDESKEVSYRIIKGQLKGYHRATQFSSIEATLIQCPDIQNTTNQLNKLFLW